jgi:outer membrane protein
MKKVLFIIAMALTGLVAHAQQVGYLSCNAVMQSMPEYTQMLQDMALLRSQYEAEQKRVEEDFNNKYEEFLDGQVAFPKTILQKRQSELQEMLDKNIAFKKESQRLLEAAEKTQMETIRQRLNNVLGQIGSERGFLLIINTDADACPWFNNVIGVDITEDVKERLK